MKNDAVQVLTCGGGEVAVGIHGQEGAGLDALGMRCARFNSGEIIGTAMGAPSIGGTGGNPFTQDCAEGEVVQKVAGINGWAEDSANEDWCSKNTLSTIQLSCRNLKTGRITVMPTVGGKNAGCKVGNLPEYSFGCGATGFLRGLVVDSANTSLYVGYVLDESCL
ncbi:MULTISPECIES: hypothetical protein [Myxococcus]|uniref:hypothetical protein n=1 Tax=Myxococcus TaxID=32 RepID=UPI00034B4939|nr:MULTISPECIES: hypothetical protein [Myxococcus]UYI16382.1 hypothetical protein N3T43_08685 [Myxococcus xanthus]UYI23744.1 hypothetical protein N1129_08685 [Myxococcus xanthus]